MFYRLMKQIKMTNLTNNLFQNILKENLLQMTSKYTKNFNIISPKEMQIKTSEKSPCGLEVRFQAFTGFNTWLGN